MKHLILLLCITSFLNIPTLLSQQKIDTIVEQEIKVFDSLARINPQQTLDDFNAFYDANQASIEASPIALEQAYYARAKYYYYINDFENSKSTILKGLKLIEERNLEVPKFYYNLLIAAILGTENKIDSAAYYYTNTVTELQERGEDAYAAQINYNIGTLYEKLDVNDALHYFDKTLAYYNTIEDSLKDPSYSFMVGNIAFYTEKTDSLEKAKKLAFEALHYGDKFKEPTGMISGRLTLADYHKKSNLLDSASYYSKKAYDLARANNFKTFYIQTAVHYASLIVDENPFNALEILKEVPKTGVNRDMRFSENLDLLYARAYTGTNNFKEANFHLQQHIHYKDSVQKLETEIKTADILEKYETAEKELKIAEQQAEITQKENQRKTLLIVSIGLGILAILGFLFFRQRQHNQKQKIISLENEKENVALRSLMAGEEKERSRIAKEIHDGLGGVLAAAKMHASKGDDTQKVVELLDTASKESRRISHNLLPESLLKKGLDQALKDFTQTINESGLLKTEYQSINLSENLSQSLQLSVYRIVQELINNIIKHAGASEALIQLQQEAKKLILTVEDDGKGFNTNQMNNGIGLQNIESRLSLLKGTLEIDSKEKQGTSVYIELQLEK